MSTSIINMLSIDVEDYFQVSAFENVSPPSTWPDRQLRVQRNTEKILAILDHASVKATFFVLGWVAERCPGLVKRIAAEGHEIASHGYGHRRVYNQTQQEFRKDVRRSKAMLEDLTGQVVIGYRAPSYSISEATSWAFDELFAAGFEYDSSVFPIRHDLYGLPDWPRFPFYVQPDGDDRWYPVAVTDQANPSLREIPITTLNLLGKNLPIAGGGYFRLFPYAITRWGLLRINRRERRSFIFYLHPWELDPGQPRMAEAGLKSRFRHYLNLHKTEGRFRKLLKDFALEPISKNIACGKSLR